MSPQQRRGYQVLSVDSGQRQDLGTLPLATSLRAPALRTQAVHTPDCTSTFRSKRLKPEQGLLIPFDGAANSSVKL